MSFLYLFWLIHKNSCYTFSLPSFPLGFIIKYGWRDQFLPSDLVSLPLSSPKPLAITRCSSSGLAIAWLSVASLVADLGA